MSSFCTAATRQVHARDRKSVIARAPNGPFPFMACSHQADVSPQCISLLHDPLSATLGGGLSRDLSRVSLPQSPWWAGMAGELLAWRNSQCSYSAHWDAHGLNPLLTKPSPVLRFPHDKMKVVKFSPNL